MCHHQPALVGIAALIVDGGAEKAVDNGHDDSPGEAADEQQPGEAVIRSGRRCVVRGLCSRFVHWCILAQVDFSRGVRLVVTDVHTMFYSIFGGVGPSLILGDWWGLEVWWVFGRTDAII